MGETELSVVVPVYGCRDCLRALVDRLLPALASIAERYEIVFVDDRSPDGAWETLVELAEQHPEIRAYRFSRNFGQPTAITAGVACARGDWIVVMDCDLQDRPEDIAQLLTRAREGYDIVFSRRSGRTQSLFRRAGAWAYFRLRNAMLGVELDRQHGSLMLFSRKVADEFLRVRDRDRHHVLILYWLGFSTSIVTVEHDARHAGRSSYTLRRLFVAAFEGMFFQTTRLLRWIVYAGFAFAAAGIALGVGLVVLYLVRNPAPGWTSLAVLILLVGGFVVVSLGVIGLYIGKIFEQVKDRPLYVIDETTVWSDDREMADKGRNRF